MTSCNMDCFSCMLPDCVFDDVTEEERKLQDQYDRELIRERIPEERKALRKYGLALYDYNHSPKGKARQKRYQQTEKGKERQKRYEQTEKGKETAKKKAKKRVASGKNAEYCRRYYQKKKAEREAAKWTA